jgi:adenosylcobinamide-phosphate synthase
MPGDPRVLLGAFALDWLAGEPPASCHPVVWMGWALDRCEARAPADGPGRRAYGLLVALGLPLGWAILAGTLERHVPWPLQALALKPSLAGRALLEAGRHVERAFERGDPAAARAGLRALVSRPTARLDGPLIASATIESLAENLVDSWVAPLLAFCGWGLAGAYAYRAANTADAMWGYRSPRYSALGNGAARLDDVLSWLPARLGAACLMLAAPRRADALGAWWRDGGRTASPNAGQVMAVAAGALGVRLEKPEHYVLNGQAPPPTPASLGQARRLVATAMALAAGLSLLLAMAGRGRG